MRVSVVIPAHNEADNVGPLAEEVDRALAPRDPYEIVFVDDASVDGTADRLRALREQGLPIRVMRHTTRSGQSAAIVTGVRAARAPWIVTMDGDGQNDPADVPRLLDLAWQHEAEGRALVAGLRLKRQDRWSRRMATRVANGLRQWLLNDGCVDTGCGLKAFRRDAFLRLPYFNGMHRFLPALFQMHGYTVSYEPVGHRPRLHGQTKYTNWRRALIGIADLRGVLWLKRRTVLPEAVVEE